MIRVLRAGLQTSVQDAGRHGLRHLGVGQAGAADHGALRLANRLLGNPGSAAGLEITLLGPTLAFSEPRLLALAGAAIDARVDERPVRCGRPFRIGAGQVLQLGRCSGGARSYLAVAGGLRVESMLGSASTDLGGGFGGHQGRALRRGDRLAMHAAPRPPKQTAKWWAGQPEDPLRSGLPGELLRILPAADACIPKNLPGHEWRVDPRSSRKALRLKGPPLVPDEGAQRVSAPVAFGDIQLLPDGEPLLLGVEAQTVGGYPLLGRVIRADRGRIGQLRPGDSVRFMVVDLARADAAWSSLEAGWQRLDLALVARGVVPHSAS